MKTYKRIFIMLFGVVLFGLPNAVRAYTLELGEIDKKANEASIPINIKLDEGEKASAITNVKCDTNYEGVECSISGLSYDAKANAFLLDETVTNGQRIATMIITNTEESQASGVTATLNYADKTVTTSKAMTLGAMVKEVPKSSNAKLSKVTVSKGAISPSFAPETLDYTVYDVPDTVNSIIFNYDCQDKNCSVEMDGGVSIEGQQKVTLNIGENIIKLKSTAEDGTSTVTYSFKVFRGETTFNSAKLKSLVIGDYEISPKFDKDTYEYTATVPYSLITLTTSIAYESEDENATVEVKGHDNLVVGENTIEISVKNKLDTETKVYKIVVTRLNDQDIIVKFYKDGIIKFIDAEEKEKELTEEEFEKQYPDEWAKIKNKTYEFDEDGNIKVKEKDTTQTENKEDKKDSKTWLVVLLVVLGIAIIGVSGFFIFKKPSDKKGKKDKDNKEEVKPTEEKEEPVEIKDVDDDLLNLAEDQDDIRENPEAELSYDVEKEIESVEHIATKRNLDDTIDIDEALSDLMSTRQYNFDDEDEK